MVKYVQVLRDVEKWKMREKTENLDRVQFIFLTFSFPSCMTEEEPNICLSGNNYDRLPIFIPLTFREERVEWFDNNKCVIVFTCSLLRGWELREPGRMWCNPNSRLQPASLASLVGFTDFFGWQSHTIFSSISTHGLWSFVVALW